MNSYKFAHITDLVNIENNDIDAFCKELPELIQSLKSVKVVSDIAGADLSKVTPFIEWAADDDHTVTVNVKFTGD